MEVPFDVGTRHSRRPVGGGLGGFGVSWTAELLSGLLRNLGYEVDVAIVGSGGG